MQGERLGDNAVLVMAVGSDGSIWPDDGVLQVGLCADFRPWADDAGAEVNLRAGIDGGAWVNCVAASVAEVLVDFVIGFVWPGASVKPGSQCQHTIIT